MDAHPVSHPTDRTLVAYGLGRLDSASAGAVYAHLQGCPDCRRRVGALSTDSSLGRLRDANARPASQDAVLSCADGRSRPGTAPPAGPPPASTLPPGLADDPDYQVLRELGQGGMGVVYLARNALMGRPEVLKVVSGHLVNRRGVLDRFLGEIRNAAKLHHPNIVAAFSARRLGDSLVLAMEYVEGSDLARVVRENGPLPVAHACYYAYQAALGLQHAHEHGMVHRDIKPSNLMLARQGNRAVVKVLDFGLAKVQSEGAVDSGLTHEGQMLGTPDYIAPEQIRDARHADIRADIYSLGCTLYYLLTGQPPFRGTSLYDLLQAHHSMDATPLHLVRPGVPPQVAAIVAQMMAKEPGRRFQEPREVAQALRPYFKPGEAASPESKPIESAREMGTASWVPAAESPRPADAPPSAATLIEPREEIGRGRPLVGSPTWAIAALAVALLASLTAVAWTWVVRGRDRAGADRTPRAVQTGPIANPAPAPGPEATPPERRPEGDDPEDLVRDALADVRRGNLTQARLLLNQYLSHPGSGKQVDAARALVRDIDLATSSVEAEALARRLSDRDISGYLANGGQPLVDSSVQSPDLRRVYSRTLLQAFRQERSRRQSAPKDGAVPAEGPRQGMSLATAAVPKARSDRYADAHRPPAKLSGLNDRAAPTPGKVPVRNGPTTLEMVLDSPGSFEGRVIPLEGLYKVGTLLTPVKGSDGQLIGSSLPVGASDDRLICKGDGKVIGRDRYLVLDSGLAPVLLRAYNEYHFHHAARPAHKCTLTVTVRPMVVNDARVPVISVVGLEILGVCDFLHVAEGRYERAFMTVHVTPGTSSVAYGDGAAWVERLGGEEKFLKPLRRKLKELRRRAIAERDSAILGNMLQVALAQSVNMAIANQQQQARFVAAFLGRR